MARDAVVPPESNYDSDKELHVSDALSVTSDPPGPAAPIYGLTP